MTGKPLSALLQILRAHGVTEYVSPQITLKLGPAPARRARGDVVDVTPDDVAAARARLSDDDPDGDEMPGDMRFALERLGPKHFPSVKADPRKAKQ